MQLDYFYCHSCGFEAANVFCVFARSVANGSLYKCPKCEAENFAKEDSAKQPI